MIKKKRYALILTVFLAALMLASVSFAYAEDEKTAAEEPIREVHKVAVDKGTYCFFVTHNVVLTPEEISAVTDDEALTALILGQAGLYMKEYNCKLDSHKAIKLDSWDKGRLFLSEEDITAIRVADPADGSPVKLYMDLWIETEPATDEVPAVTWSTFKKTSPRLIFIAVATEEDAKTPEDICEAPAVKPPKQKKEKIPSVKNVPEPEEILPEYRTINMADRSGKPVEDTLQDGTPVTLEWIEPSKRASDKEGTSFIDHIPGRYFGLAAIIAALTALIILLIKRRKEDED